MSTHVFFDKRTAEVKGFGSTARIGLDAEDRERLAHHVAADQMRRLLTPPELEEPDGIADLYPVLYGGLINTPSDALAYAGILLDVIVGRSIPAPEMRAVEQEGVWSIERHRADRADATVLRFGRSTGKILAVSLEDI